MTASNCNSNWAVGRHLGRLRPSSLLEWVVIAFLAYASFSHPLFIQYFFPSGMYKVGFAALLGLSILLFAMLPGRHRFLNLASLRDPVLLLLLVAYLTYMVLLTLATMVHADSSTFGDLMLAYIKITAGLLLFAVFSPERYRWTLDRYTNLVMVGALASLLVVCLVFMGGLSPLGEVGLKGIGETSREFYGLSLGWGQLPVPGGYSIIRLQSFADEPGTFAFMLLIAIVWAFYRGWRWQVVTMVVALFLTWSVGAILAGAILLLSYLAKKRSVVIFVAALLLIIFIALIYWSNADLLDIVTNYLATKNGDEQGTTSYGERVEYISKLMALISAHPEGVGPGVKAAGFTSPVGWLVPLSESGVVGFLFYCIAGGGIVLLAVFAAWRAKGEYGVLGIMVLILAFSALQRARIDYSVWHFWILTAFLKFRVSHRQFHRSSAVSGRLGSVE